MIYGNVSASRLLSAESSRLGTEELVVLIELAEDLLGLTGTNYIDVEGERAERAIALQVNYLVTLGGADAFVFTSVARGGRSWSFRGDASAGPALVSPLAKAIVDRLSPQGENRGNEPWGAVRSRRRGA